MLSPAVEENRRNQDQAKGSMKLQCLKCKQEFSQFLPPWHQGSYPSELGDTKILETLVASDQGKLWWPGEGCLLINALADFQSGGCGAEPGMHRRCVGCTGI